MKIFFDTSAFVKRYIEESGTEKVVHLCEQASMIYLSQLTISELFSATNRLLRDKTLTPAQYNLIKSSFFKEITDITFFGISSKIILESILLLEKHQLRTLDAIQLTTAMKTNMDLFVSSDKQQIVTAQNEKIKCLFV